MRIPYVAIRRYAHDARQDYREYVNSNAENVKMISNAYPYKVELKDGTLIYFMSEITYPTWCLGRTYKAFGDENERVYHSGYEVDNESELECAKKFSKDNHSFDYILELPKRSGN